MEILHVINLDTENKIDKYASADIKKLIIRNREERMLSIVRQAKYYSFAIRAWEGITDDEVFPCRNISRSFKRIIQYAKEERLPFIRIAEDDMKLTSKNSWSHYIQNTPDDYDIYLGGIYAGRLDGNRIIDQYSGHTLITVHERFYDFFLSADEDHQIDNWLGRYAMEKKYFVTQPFVVKQMKGYSENKKMIPDYSMHESGWTYL